jgi:1,4-dihydroxy-2-naphthoate octaprenyltransferase
VPVALGAAVAWWATHETGAHSLPTGSPAGTFDWWKPLVALVVALALQVGTNYANDHSDGVRGTDVARVGPLRLVGSGLVAPRVVKIAAWSAFGVAGVAGVVLALTTSWWLVPIGVLAVAAGWLYTGGPRPYGYLGLGELFVFVFFGLVATIGTLYVAVGSIPAVGWPTAVAGGLLATALLEANNLRDIAGDATAGKRTLAVRLGRHRAGWLYVGSLVGVAASLGLVALWRPWASLGILALPLAVPSCRLALSRREGRELLPMLPATGRLQLLVGLLLVVGILW